MANRIQLRRDTAANWVSVNPTLASGEIGLETDTAKFKVGNGTNTWMILEYGGIKGDTGLTGPTGADGADSTVPGPQGLQGDPGTPGAQGNQGIQGPAGLDSTVPGPQGEQGLQGIQGLTGADSIVPGPKGDTGNTGLQGIQGVPGADSVVPGPQGIQGVPGADGAQGIQGIQGIKGDTGDIGPQGNQGIQGIQGIQGPQGEIGPQGPAGSGTGYAINVQALTSSPTDAQTVYFGTLPKAPITTANVSKVYIPKTGIIKWAEIYCYSGTAGTAEAWSLYIRLNNTTDTLIATLSVSASERRFYNSALNISVTAGNYIEIKGVQPTWATNPLTTIYGGYIYIE